MLVIQHLVVWCSYPVRVYLPRNIIFNFNLMVRKDWLVIQECLGASKPPACIRKLW